MDASYTNGEENQEMNPPPPTTELGDKMINVVEASDQWSEWRTVLATQMFNEWQASRGTTSSHKKGKPRRFWNHREELFLITTMKDVTASNPRWKFDNNQFRVGFYNECEKKILSTFPGTDLRATPHIDSKIKLWRKQYNILQDMLKISGFGWDDEQKMVLVDSDDPFPFYEDWLLLFGKDRATGELAEDLANAVTTMEKEDANAITEGEQSPVEQFSMNMGDTDYSMSTTGNVPNRADSTKTGKKRAQPAEGIPIELSEMAKNLGSFIENTNITMVEIAYRIGYSHDLSQQRRLEDAGYAVGARVLELLFHQEKVNPHSHQLKEGTLLNLGNNFDRWPALITFHLLLMEMLSSLVVAGREWDDGIVEFAWKLLLCFISFVTLLGLYKQVEKVGA
ncbi:unnamed protein product [Camellia sinensis]